jgi:hypothetical protein
MKLRDLKLDQHFRFATGSDQSTYRIVKSYPDVQYTTLRGLIVYRPNYASRLNRDVIVLNDIELLHEIEFTDIDGDRVIFTTETEADFVHILISPFEGKSNIAALKRNQVVELINFLQRHLDIKD